jgi:small subunit ribosomal protein S16
MLAIRMQRTGRKGHAQFRVVVQDSRFSPTSGRVVEYLGSYNPHTKTTTLDKEKAQTYLSNGAQPSDRVVILLKQEGVKLPAWVKEPSKHERTIRNPEKLRRNRPAEPAAETPAAEIPVDETAESPVEETAPVEADTEVEAQPDAPAEPEEAQPAEADAAAEAESETPAADSEETPDPEAQS